MRLVVFSVIIIINIISLRVAGFRAPADRPAHAFPRRRGSSTRNVVVRARGTQLPVGQLAGALSNARVFVKNNNNNKKVRVDYIIIIIIIILNGWRRLFVPCAYGEHEEKENKSLLLYITHTRIYILYYIRAVAAVLLLYRLLYVCAWVVHGFFFFFTRRTIRMHNTRWRLKQLVPSRTLLVLILTPTHHRRIIISHGGYTYTYNVVRNTYTTRRRRRIMLYV